MNKKLLILEDDLRLGKTLKLEFEEKNYNVFWSQNLANIPNETFDYAIVDLRLANDSGLDAITLLKEINSEINIVILTGHGSIATTVEAMKRGANNYLIKPASISRIEEALLDKTPNIEETDGPQTLSEFEHEFIEYMLLKNNNNISKTAKALGLHRQSLQRKLKKLP
ncbi:MAG: response regulator [Bacteriovoracaceae bacterium]